MSDLDKYNHDNFEVVRTDKRFGGFEELKLKNQDSTSAETGHERMDSTAPFIRCTPTTNASPVWMYKIKLEEPTSHAACWPNVTLMTEKRHGHQCWHDANLKLRMPSFSAAVGL
ncbi:hypothetical protein JOM56_008092 [Amanita muscaria]